jgi:hypothetical protein
LLQSAFISTNSNASTRSIIPSAAAAAAAASLKAVLSLGNCPAIATLNPPEAVQQQPASGSSGTQHSTG